MQGPSRLRRRSPWWSILAVVGLLTISLGAFHVGASSGLSPRGSLGEPIGSSRGATELSNARASLAGGAAPSQGTPLACSSVASTIHCDLARMAVAPGTSPIGPLVWSNLTTKLAPAPSARVAQMTWDSGDGYVLLFGGIGCQLKCKLVDTWSFSNGVWTNLTATTTGSPPFLYIAGMASDPSTGKVILFGGFTTSSTLTAYTWSYHAGAWTNLSSTVGATPPGRALPAMTSDTTDGEIVMTGGQTSNGYTWDTWVFKGGTWTNVSSIAGTSGRIVLPTASDDPAEHGVLLFGPWMMGPRALEATLVYSAGAWHNLTSSLSGGSPLALAATAGYLPALGAVVAYSGASVNRTGSTVYVSQTWEFANGAWKNLTDLTGTQPALILGEGAAVDPGSNALIFFGGDENTSKVPYPPDTTAYTWVLSAPPIVSASASKSEADSGQSVTFTATVTGGFTPNTLSWNFGDGSANSSATSAAHAYTGSGLMVATVTATSFVGSSSSAVVSVFVNPALSAQPNVSASPTVGTLTYFSPGLTGGSAPFTFSWSFGDGGTSTAADASHTFTKASTFTATLKVTDSAGATATKNLSVVVGAAPAVSLTSGTGLGLLLGIIALLVLVVVLAVLLMRKPKNPVVMAPASVAPYVATPPPSPPPA